MYRALHELGLGEELVYMHRKGGFLASGDTPVSSDGWKTLANANKVIEAIAKRLPKGGSSGLDWWADKHKLALVADRYDRAWIVNGNAYPEAANTVRQLRERAEEGHADAKADLATEFARNLCAAVDAGWRACNGAPWHAWLDKARGMIAEERATILESGIDDVWWIADRDEEQSTP